MTTTLKNIEISTRARETWAAIPMMTARDQIAAEVSEAFGPVRGWARLAPIEQADCWQEVADIPVTLACWGWQVGMVRTGDGGWSITASKQMDGIVVAGKGRGDDLASALHGLDTALSRKLATVMAVVEDAA